MRYDNGVLERILRTVPFVDTKNRRKRRIAAGLLAAAVVACVVICKFVGAPLLKFLSDSEALRSWVDSRGWTARLAFVGMVILQVILAFIPGEPFEVAAGFAFGVTEGTILSIAAAAVGSVITFALVRKFGMRLVRIFFSEEKINSVKFLKTSEARNFLFLIIYMLPGTPKDLLGYFAGLTDIPFPIFCLICTLGRIPSVITSTISGNALGTKSYGAAIITFAITLAISGIGLLIYNKICKRHTSGQPEETA